MKLPRNHTDQASIFVFDVELHKRIRHLFETQPLEHHEAKFVCLAMPPLNERIGKSFTPGTREYAVNLVNKYEVMS